jgi:hypothetical protein
MPFTFSRAAIVGLLLALTAGGAYGDDLGDFNAAVERAASHNRAADGYLRTGNVDLASLELDRLRESWAALTQRFGGKRPEVFKDGTLYTTTLLKISTGLVGADMMLKSGRMDAARKALDGMRGDLYDLRRSAGVVVLADCIRDASKIAGNLFTYDDPKLDWDKAEIRTGLAAAATGYVKVLERCDGIASPAVRANPEFRRLIDGARSGLAFIPKAIETRDTNMVHRVMGEMRAIDNLLAFRFG